MINRTSKARFKTWDFAMGELPENQMGTTGYAIKDRLETSGCGSRIPKVAGDTALKLAAGRAI